MQLSLYKKAAFSLYLPLSLALAVLCQLVGDGAWRAVCYSLILIDLAFALLLYNGGYRWLFTVLALTFTAVSDFFLVVCTPERATLGVAFFIPVQIFYFTLIYLDEGGKFRKIHLFVRIILSLLALFMPILVLGKRADLLSVLSVVYFVNLILNVVFSTFAFKKSPLLSLGLMLFLLCDLFVGLGGLDMYFTVEQGSFLYAITHTGLNMPWIFYAPSQILLTLSMIETKKDGC